MSRLPIRIRLTLPFALAMTLVLAALGAYVYLRVGSTLLSSTDQACWPRPQRRRCGSTVAEPRSTWTRRTGRGSRRCSTRRGGVVLSQPTVLPPLLSPTQARGVAGGGSLRTSSSIVGESGRWRLLAVPDTAGRSTGHSSLRSLDARSESLERLAQGASRRLAARAPSRNAGGRRPRRCCAPSRRGDAAQSSEHLAATPEAGSRCLARTTSFSGSPRRSTTCSPARDRLRARAAIRRIREPRAANAARVLDRARAGAPPSEVRAPSSTTR